MNMDGCWAGGWDTLFSFLLLIVLVSEVVYVLGRARL